VITAFLRRAGVLSCILVPLFVCAPARAATTFAPNRFDDPPVGGTFCTPPAPVNGCSLRGAVAAAQQGDAVQLSTGTYQLALGALVLPKKITILGAGPAATTIRQTALDRVIKIENQAGLTISGVTISGGHVVAKAGADGASPSQAGEDGEAAFGAGIEAGGPVTLTDVVVTGNSAYGGDGGDGANGTAGVGGSGGRGGTADGAGISGGNPLVLTRVAVTNNLAQPGKAGAGGDGGTATAGGAGGFGGAGIGAGVSLGAAPLTATDVLIAGNTANATPGGKGGRGGTASGVGGAGGQGEAADGGGLFSNGVVKLTNVTIAGNSAAGGTGGTGGAARSISTPTKGGAGGSAFSGSGGGVALFNGAAGQFASVTIAGNTVTSGIAGNGGAGSDGGVAGANGAAFANGGGNLFVTKGRRAPRTARLPAAER
jgi:hypothetical protein